MRNFNIKLLTFSLNFDILLGSKEEHMSQKIARFGSPNQHYCPGLDEANGCVVQQVHDAYNVPIPTLPVVIQIFYGAKTGKKMVVGPPGTKAATEEIQGCPYCHENLVRESKTT